MALRRRAPGLERPFTTPLIWVIGPLAVLGCAYLFTSLQARTIIFFFVWNAVGLVVYLVYARRTSALAAG
jgi:APA family basic amino acid/polyamine antiporter